jgi:hypothetical protein
MIGFDSQMIQYFLNRNPYRCAAAPYGDDKTGPESAFENAQAELKGIIQQFLGGQVAFVFIHNQKKCSS